MTLRLPRFRSHHALVLLPGLALLVSCAAEDPPTVEDRLAEHSAGVPSIVRDDDGEVVAVVGRLRPPPEAALDAERIATWFLETFGDLWGVDDPSADLELIDRVDGEMGHVGPSAELSYRRKVGDLPVVGAVLKVTVGNGFVTSAMGYVPRDLDVPSSPAVAEADAVAAVVDAEPDAGSSSAELSVLNEGIFHGTQLDPSRLVWAVRVSAGLESRTRFVDATDGALLDFTLEHVVSGRDREVSQGSGSCSDDPAVTTSEECLEWIVDNAELVYEEGGMVPGTMPTADATTAYDALATTYDYFQTTHERDSYDDGGSVLRAYTDVDDLPENAAAFEHPDGGLAMIHGEGMVTTDIVAHEWGHMLLTAEGVDSAGGTQTAEMHEAISDIFGAMVDESDPYLIGEGSTVGTIRRLANPVVDHMDDYVTTDDPHVNATIVGHAFYLAAEGTARLGLEGIGRQTAGSIYYNAADGYFTPALTFDLARIGLWLSGRELADDVADPIRYQDCAMVINGLSEVGIGDGDRDLDCVPDDVDICPDYFNPDQADPAVCLRPFGSCQVTEDICVNYHERTAKTREGCELGGGTWMDDACPEDGAEAACVLYIGTSDIQVEVYYDVPDATEDHAFAIAQCFLRADVTGGPGVWMPEYHVPSL